MNRQERRRLKKNNKLNQVVNRDLLEGIKFHTNKDYKKAEILYKKALASEPSNYDVIRHLGILNQDLEKFEEAYNFFIQAVKVNPKGFEAINNLATIHINNKNYELALKCLSRSLEINGNYVPTINNLAGYYHKVHEPKKALEFSSKSLRLQPNNPLARNQHSKALIDNNRLEEAIQILEKLSSEYPDSDDFKFNLSSAYREIGEIEKSNKLASEGFKKNFKKISFFLGYTKDKKSKLSEEQITYYESLLKKDDLHHDDRTSISHSFFEYYKNQKDFQKAGGYLVKGNNTHYATREFNLKQEEQYFEKLKSVFSKKIDFICKDRATNRIPIFVCGMPRSGTTLCEQILSSHSKITGAGELSYLADISGISSTISPNDEQMNNFENTLNDKKSLMNVRKLYLEELALHDQGNSNYVCDKMPHNFVLIGLIRVILPEAKIIYCKRDPIDNCFSLYSHKFVEISHQYSYDQKVLAHYYKMHTKLMDFWLMQSKSDIFILDNEELVNNQEKVSRQIIEFCDLNWEKECLEFYKTKRQVRTASIEQVRKPMNNKSIGAWKNYETYLQDLVLGLK